MKTDKTKVNLWLQSIPEDTQNRFKQLAELIEPVVEEIHSKRPLHQNYYGEYMSAISTLTAKHEKTSPKYWGVVFLLAGANQQGINAAVNNL